MPKQATKAADNAFYKARIAASKCNDRLASREGASEELGIDRTRLARIELGSLNPYPEEVLLMADYYDAPELANHYCSQIYVRLHLSAGGGRKRNPRKGGIVNGSGNLPH